MEDSWEKTAKLRQTLLRLAGKEILNNRRLSDSLTKSRLKNGSGQLWLKRTLGLTGLTVESDLLAITSAADSKFDTNKEFVILNIFKYKYSIVLISHVICHVTPFLKIFNNRQIGGGIMKTNSSNNICLIHIKYFKHFTFQQSVHCTSLKNIYNGKHYSKCPKLILNY